MKVESKYMIEGKVVEKIYSFCGFDVYQHKVNNQDGEVILFFTKEEYVMSQLLIEADCGQNCGYISNLEFRKET